MTWNTVSKPTTSGWTNTNPAGRTQYDQSDITYDDANTFYDGVDLSAWTEVSKHGGYGDYTWAEMTIMWSQATQMWGDDGTDWTKITKPT